MIESITLKILLLLYIFIAGFIVFLLFKNPNAPSSITNVGILFASIIPVLVAVLPYINTQLIREDFNYIIFYDSINKKIVTGEGFGPYIRSYFNIFSNLDNKELTYNSIDDLFPQKGIDLIEKGILVGLFLNFSNTWDITFVKHLTPQGKNIESIVNSVPQKVFTSSEIIELFKENKFINKNTIIWRSISLPAASSIRVDKSDDKDGNKGKVESIIIQTPKSEITIRIVPVYYSVYQHGLSGLFNIDKSNINRFYMLNYRVSFLMKYGLFEKYSNLMDSYNHFQLSLIEILRNMDWGVVENEIQKNFLKKSSEKF